jgi:peptidyl-prolyl cis-trans isomerase SurA
MKFTISLIACLLCIIQPVLAQHEGKLIDEVVAVVGNRIILESDLETQVLQYQSQGITTGKETLKCEILEDLMI